MLVWSRRKLGNGVTAMQQNKQMKRCTVSKNIVAISSSLRAKSNSEVLLDSFVQGAKSAGNDVKVVSLKGKTIKYCIGCLTCQRTGKCVLDDDARAIAELVKNADVLVFATPIYYYEMSGQLKTLIDRLNPLYGTDYKFTDVYFLSTAADDAEGTDERAVNGLGGWIECFERSKLCGKVFAGGVDDGGAIEGHPALKQAFDMGASIK